MSAAAYILRKQRFQSTVIPKIKYSHIIQDQFTIVQAEIL